LALGALAVLPCDAQAGRKAKGKAMTSAEFDQLMKAKDWTAVEVARQGGPPVVPKLEPYLKSPDHVIRLLAVDAAAAAGGPEAAGLLIHSLRDGNEQVRANAANGLHVVLPVGREQELLSTWDQSNTRDGYVRQQIPMILGLMKATSTIGVLKPRMNADPRQEVKDGVVAGLAKLGDPDARRTLGDMLRDARGTRTAALIEFVKYENEPWVIPLLVPVLDRRDMAVDLSTHRREIHRRECDLAVDEVVRISKARFTFPIDPIGQYTEPQIAEARRYAEAQPRQ
jgi:HEAT repeat protein